MNVLNVCLCNDSFPPLIDGVANAVLNYASVINSEYGRSVVAVPEYPDVTDNYSFPVIRYPNINTTRFIGYRAGMPFSPDILSKFNAMGIDLIHSHCPAASTILARGLLEIVNAPVVFTYHTKFDIDIARAIKGNFLQDMAIKMLVENISACDEVWVVSRGAGDNLRSLGYGGDYIVMENGVDLPLGTVSPEKIAEVTGTYDLPSGLPVFLFVGRLMWYKGIDLMLDSLSCLKERGAAFRMVFIGDGGDREEIEKRAGELGLEECIFVGAVSDRDDLRAWYCRADILLFPSTFDTNGLVVREAAACSLGSILVRDSCAAEGVTDGRNGILIEKDVPCLTEKLLALCSADGAEQMKRIGEAAAKELYISWEDSIGRAFSRYETVCENWKSGLYENRRKDPLDDLYSIFGDIGAVLERARSTTQKLKGLFDGRYL
ncbi:MAG: glycosyltransferase [Oscillospiraceae bacterium]|nr:glycosyltransferase [Oscillospiraceae bacterium]